MKYECCKLFVKRKAWFVILIFMLLRLVTVFCQRNDYADYDMAMYPDAFRQHMEVLEGRLTDEKAAYIDRQNETIREMLSHSGDMEQYIRGEITAEEYNAQCQIHKDGERLRDECSGINVQYARVSQNPDRVYFLYTLGWTGLLGNEHFDVVLVALLIVLTVPVICNEYASEMYPVLRTTVNGGVRLYLCKTAVSILTALLSVLLLFSVECAYYGLIFGLPGGTFPLQTLSPFADSPYQISIYAAAALTLLNRCFGAVFLTVLLLCLSALLRRAMSAAFLGALCVFMPLMLFSESAMKYLLPTPLGFLLSCGFLKSRFPVRPGAQEFLTVTPAQYRETACISAVLILLLFLLGLFAFCGWKIPRRRFIPVLMCLLLTGCAGQPAAPDLNGVVFDSWSYLREKRDFSVADSEQYGKAIVFHDSGETVPLIHDCFTALNIANTKLYIAGDTVCYVTDNEQHHCKIIALDIRDFSEQVIYQRTSYDTEDRDILFGFGQYIPNGMPEDIEISSFFVHSGQLFMQRTDSIVCCDLQTGTETRLYEGKTQNLAATCGYLYFINDMWDLCRYDMQKGCAETLPVSKTRRIYAVENGLYCHDVKDNNFYYVSADGSTKELLPDFDELAFMKGVIP